MKSTTTTDSLAQPPGMMSIAAPAVGENDMPEVLKPAKTFVARAVPDAEGGFNAMFAAPGLIPVRSTRFGDPRPLRFETEDEAVIEAMRALFALLNRPREKARHHEVKLGRPKRLTGAELALQMEELGMTRELLALIYGTSLNRILQWIDGVEDIPHPIRVLLALFRDNPDRNIDIAEAVTNEAIEGT